jgi:hypothetical protein
MCADPQGPIAIVDGVGVGRDVGGLRDGHDRILAAGGDHALPLLVGLRVGVSCEASKT